MNIKINDNPLFDSEAYMLELFPNYIEVVNKKIDFWIENKTDLRLVVDFSSTECYIKLYRSFKDSDCEKAEYVECLTSIARELGCNYHTEKSEHILLGDITYLVIELTA